MSVWDWLHEQYAELEEGDARLELFRLLVTANDLRDTDVEGALGLYDEGRALAVRQNEPWWTLMFDHWKLQCLIFHKRDLVTAQSLAVACTVEVRKPQYRAFPQRVCLHEDLIHVYDNLDPVGYDERVRKALDYMESEVGEGYECKHCIVGLRGSHCSQIGEIEEAFACNQRAGQMAAEAESDHYLANAYSTLCSLIDQVEGWDEDMLGAIQAGMGAAYRAERPERLREFSAWEALTLRRLGREEEASRAWERCLRIDEQIATKPGSELFNAMAGYFTAADDFEQALAVRDREARDLAGSGFHFDTVRCEIQRLLLKQALGRATPADVEAVDTAAKGLVDRGWVDAFLEQFGESDRATMTP